MAEIRCADKTCRWNKRGKCILFAGVTQLECKYRIEPKPKTTNKKGK